MSSQAFNITLPNDLVAKVDKIAKENYTSRSDIIRRALVREVKLREDDWQPVVDFTKIDKNGVNAKDILKAIQK